MALARERGIQLLAKSLLCSRLTRNYQHTVHKPFVADNRHIPNCTAVVHICAVDCPEDC
jgi:hypothetical protein